MKTTSTRLSDVPLVRRRYLARDVHRCTLDAFITCAQKPETGLVTSLVIMAIIFSEAAARLAHRRLTFICYLFNDRQLHGECQKFCNSHVFAPHLILHQPQSKLPKRRGIARNTLRVTPLSTHQCSTVQFDCAP